MLEIPTEIQIRYNGPLIQDQAQKILKVFSGLRCIRQAVKSLENSDGEWRKRFDRAFRVASKGLRTKYFVFGHHRAGCKAAISRGKTSLKLARGACVFEEWDILKNVILLKILVLNYNFLNIYLAIRFIKKTSHFSYICYMYFNIFLCE